jgi:hypothetical protein
VHSSPGSPRGTRPARRRVDDLDLQVRLHAPDRAHPAFERIVGGGLEGLTGLVSVMP